MRDILVLIGFSQYNQNVYEDRIAELSSNLSKCLFDMGGSPESREADTEMIALSAIALNNSNPRDAQRLREWLYNAQEKTGAWRPRASLPASCWSTSLAMIALALEARQDCLARALQWLLLHAGRESGFWVKLRFRCLDRRVHFNPAYYGWPWTEGTLSWVIPTSFAIMAIRLSTACQRPPEAVRRLRPAVSMALDRGCLQGGWNAGNGVVDRVALSPRMEPTAIALLGLRGISPPTRLIESSIQWLRREAATCPTPWSLSWAILSLFSYGLDVDNLKIHLADLAAKLMRLSPLEMAGTLLALQTGQTLLPFVMPDES
ncbi:MAG: hypothetical protein WB676_04845 [Bryobacteraceae bacterium]